MLKTMVFKSMPPIYRLLQWKEWWWIPLLVFLPFGAACGAFVLLANQNVGPEVLRAAGTVGIGFAGLITLGAVLHRQGLQARDQEHREYDAAEKRATDLYMQAAEQLGHDSAAVRLAGIYGMEQLGCDFPERRHVVVNVICAYLRTPYFPPEEQILPGTEPYSNLYRQVVAAKQNVHEDEQKSIGERAIRMAAQRVLADHLRDPRPAEQRLGKLPEIDRQFWGPIPIDLNNAFLVSANFDDCHFGFARFSDAQFYRNAGFSRAIFHDEARFNGTTFHGNLRFIGARFISASPFHHAAFCGMRTDFTGAEPARDGFQGATARVHEDHTWPPGWTLVPSEDDPSWGRLLAEGG